ncbi:E3 ubiquitin-protein ligase RGLG3 [Citrus sinensis]|uniref:E3 ubiquitin-protein ligase RGLG3 n=1 Tax=Citrus sinensis TaxID=2711 RepID=A0ACB8JJA3_CITSI|nr:E3 ubiquitin-protein ligase RGLG3 [Citrus sinensis]
MGNTESGYDDDSHEHFRHQRPSYGGSSMDHNYQPWSYTESSMDHSHQPTSYAGSSAHHSHQPMSYAGSSAHHNYQRPQQATRFADNYNTLDEVISALREAGLESSNLILGIDFTKSNEWTGKYSFNRKSLHAISNIRNPYEQAISIIGRTLSPFDEDNLIPCFGFGDGPTSFAPIIDAAIDIVEASNRQYHVLVIIADGQVTRNPDTPAGRLSPQEQATVNSIVAASHYPLSIILVGVGDGPWDSVQQFDDNIPQRAFDNFQFVNFTKIMSENKETSKKEAAFALAALMEIPLQYKATLSLHSVNGELVAGPRTRLLPPPREVIDHDNVVKSIPHMTNFETVEATALVEPVCPICLTNPKDMAFGCGHTQHFELNGDKPSLPKQAGDGWFVTLIDYSVKLSSSKPVNKFIRDGCST